MDIRQILLIHKVYKTYYNVAKRNSLCYTTGKRYAKTAARLAAFPPDFLK